MRFTLPQNAISSLHIAIENFKDFYFEERSSGLSNTERDEKIKISLVFLENSIELLLKSILVTLDETSIYKEPNSKRIKKAQSRVDANNTLSDILLQEANFHTIDYCDVVKKYINLTGEKTKKVEQVLFQLSNVRNAITHFGIEIIDYDEIVITFFNTFDVIYNYLYDRLISLDNIGEYFTSDDMIVDTVHGKKLLVSEDGIYNNILDFLDELLMDYNDYIFALRSRNVKTKISKFEDILLETIDDKKFKKLLETHGVNITLCEEDIVNKDLSFDIEFSTIAVDIIARYSPFYNATIFSNDSGEIMCIVAHEEQALYYYSCNVIYPSTTEAEKDTQWVEDEKNHSCIKLNLSKRNLLKVFEEYFVKCKKEFKIC